MPKLSPPTSCRIPFSPALVRRFLSRLEHSGGCWVWTGHKDSRGYGQIKINGRAYWAHRVAYALFRHSFPAGYEIDHTCRNPSCCNPDHLRRITPKAHRAQGRRLSRDEPPF